MGVVMGEVTRAATGVTRVVEAFKRREELDVTSCGMRGVRTGFDGRFGVCDALLEADESTTSDSSAGRVVANGLKITEATQTHNN